jgi:hypothetical protein
MARPDVLDRVFHAMSDPGRRQMLERLAEGPASVSDLDPDTFGVAEQWLTGRRRAWERRLDRLGQVLDEQAAGRTPSPTRKRGHTP